VNLFIFACLGITILCVIGLFKTLKDKNMFAAGFAAISALVFGFFSIASFIEAIGNLING
jgi:hypothetical protein